MPFGVRLCEVTQALSWLDSTMVMSPRAATTTTMLVSDAKPNSTWNGSQGFRSAFSAKHIVYLPGQPCVDFSMVSAVAPPRLRMVSRKARPMVAFPRWPEPRAAVPLWMPNRLATGPLTIPP